MIKLEKTLGVRGVANDITIFRIQEIIAIEKERLGFVGKVVIDTEKISFYKFGLKLGICRFAPNGLVVNEEGIVRHAGIDVPVIYDKELLRGLYTLFGKSCPL